MRFIGRHLIFVWAVSIPYVAREFTLTAWQLQAVIVGIGVLLIKIHDDYS